MDAHVAQELLNELGSSLENLETQQAALLRFLKDKGIVTDEQLAPYLHEAGNASSVRWRAAHVRLEHIFSAAEQKEQQTAKPEERQAAGTPPPNQQKDNEEKLAKSSMTQDANEKALTKEEKTESPATGAQTPAGGTKAHEKVPSAQHREEDAA
jgi:hypothetical protein